jgi:formamidopyrimidine-DNA glycosylase
MPELPDVTVYVERLTALTANEPLRRVRVSSPFLLRSFDPPLDAVYEKRVLGYERLGKRVVFVLEQDLFLVLHLMIAGRLKQREANAPIPKKLGLASFDFPKLSILLTEAGSKRRASLHVVRGRAQLAEFDRGGVEPQSATPRTFREALTRENRTLKRALTDPRLLSGIGNAYSDEILFWAKLSPVKRTSQLTDAEISRLHETCKKTLNEWTERLRRAVGDGFPEKVTAFHEEMAAHGRFGKACRVCETKIQRVRFADNELNYCPSCQTGGKLLADRGLSRLLKGDWPKTLAELEERKNTQSLPTKKPPK